MGKVYDALRRAEEERARRVQNPADAGPRPPEAIAIPVPEPPPSAAPSGAQGPVIAAPARADKSLRNRLGGGLHKATRDAAAINKRRIALLQPDSQVAEQFRTLRGRIDAIAASHPEHPIRSVAVTSARPGDGKTMAALSLALVTAMAVDRRVLLVDCDLRKPAVHDALGLHVAAGLAEVLNEEAKPEEATVPVDGYSLDVLPVRAIPSNPSELLASSRMQQLLQQLASRYDRVVLDLPPTLGLPDAKTVSDLCDGIVFVVRANATPREDVTSAIEVLDRRRILGLVLNDADIETRRYDYR